MRGKKRKQEDHTPQEWAAILKNRARAAAIRATPEGQAAKKAYDLEYRNRPGMKEAIAMKARERHAADPEKARASWKRRLSTPEALAKAVAYRKEYQARPEVKLKRAASSGKRLRFSLTLFDALLAVQNQACACCGIPFSADVVPRRDHCHDTNIPRGLLCHHCNLTEGHTRCTNEALTKIGLPLLEHSPQMQRYLSNPPAAQLKELWPG